MNPEVGVGLHPGLSLSPGFNACPSLSLRVMRDALASAGVAGVAVQALEDSDRIRPILYVPILRLDHPDFEEAYGLLSCQWVQWLRVAHCCLRVEATHVVACFSFDVIDQQTFDALLASIKKAEMCFV